MQTQTDVGEQWQEPQLGNYACCGKPLKVGYRHCSVCHMYWSIDGIHTCCQFTADDYTELYNVAKTVLKTWHFRHDNAEVAGVMLKLSNTLDTLPKP